LSLRELQQLFVRAVHGELPSTELDGVFLSHGQLDAQRRMRIYRFAYLARQEHVLRETFPRLCALLGDQAFGKLAIDYLRRAPSRHPAIEWVGERFPGLVTDLPPHLRDLARLEWARFAAMLAPSTKAVVTVAALAGIDFASASAELAESVTLLHVVDQALHAFHEDVAAPTPAAEARQIACVAWRKDCRSCHRSLGNVEYEALSYVRAGRPFADVCGLFPDAERAAACVGRWIRDGLLVSLRCAD
jgi:hypothetical protein